MNEGTVPRALTHPLEGMAQPAPSSAEPGEERVSPPGGRDRMDEGERGRAEWQQIESYARAHRMGYLDGMAEAASRLGGLAMGHGHMAEAEARFHLARRLAWEAGNQRLAGAVDQSLGSLARVRGDIEAALTHQRNAVAQFRAAGDDAMLAWR